jgi:hypothetical protein
LLGGFLNLHFIMNFPSGGILSVHLSAMTFQDDPIEPFADQDVGDAMDLEAARWLNPAYQQEMLGVPLSEYLGELPDVDDDAGDYPDYLGGESLEEYHEH